VPLFGGAGAWLARASLCVTVALALGVADGFPVGSGNGIARVLGLGLALALAVEPGFPFATVLALTPLNSCLQ
jgi:hypothetical protein